MGGDEREKRGSTLRPPAPGKTEEVVIRPPRRAARSAAPTPRSEAPPTDESWRPPPDESWPTLPQRPHPSSYPPLYLPHDEDDEPYSVVTDPVTPMPTVIVSDVAPSLRPRSEPPVSAPAPDARAPEATAPGSALARRKPSSRPPGGGGALVRRPSSRPPAPADPRSDGHAIRAERAVASIDARHSAIPDPLPPDRAQRITAIVAELAKSGPESDAPLRKSLLSFGADSLPILARAFPGRLWVDLNRPHRPILEASHLSGCAAALAAFGETAVPHVTLLMRAPKPEVRLAACVVAGELRRGELVRPLAARLQDELAVVRNQAMLALRACRELSEARVLRGELLTTLTDETKKKEWRQKAAWTLGQLREAEAVPHLIELVSESDLAASVRQALTLLIGKDLGSMRFRWRSWWSAHADEGRGRWLVDALDQKDQKLRARAAEELVLLTGEGFDSRNATTTREQAVELGKRYLAWFAEGEM
ncbi:MAG: hypothetical protein AB7S26_05250 [Sandaracinaceae bacterium]